MFKQIFRITFITFVWKQYKHVIVSTLILFAYLWLVGSVHEDYLSYAELQEDDSLAGRSFLMKWAAFASGVILYLVYHWFRGAKVRAGKLGSGSESKTSSGKRHAAINTFDSNNDEDDPFAAIREKKKLRSRAEIMIDKNVD